MRTCKINNKIFYLEIELFSDLKLRSDESLDVQGGTILLEKKVIRELLPELEKHEHRELTLMVKEKEYKVRLSFSRQNKYYKIMDNERIYTLGYIEKITLDAFLND